MCSLVQDCFFTRSFEFWFRVRTGPYPGSEFGERIWPNTGSAGSEKGTKLLTFCLLLLPLWESVIVLCFVVRYSMSILVLQSS